MYNAERFNEAIEKFVDWIGTGNTRIYSWSDSDLIQLKKECSTKSIHMPVSMERWLDVQLIYPRLMKIGSRYRRMSLQEAAAWYGINVDRKRVHRALYDAEITTELVMPMLSGEYKKQAVVLRQLMQEQKTGICLGDLCSEIFAKLLHNVTTEFEYVK